MPTANAPTLNQHSILTQRSVLTQYCVSTYTAEGLTFETYGACWAGSKLPARSSSASTSLRIFAPCDHRRFDISAEELGYHQVHNCSYTLLDHPRFGLIAADFAAKKRCDCPESTARRVKVHSFRTNTRSKLCCDATWGVRTS